ncbi:MAG: hypothetical protein ACXVGG_15325, partial [Mycobacteriaceae bacterium]
MLPSWAAPEASKHAAEPGSTRRCPRGNRTADLSRRTSGLSTPAGGLPVEDAAGRGRAALPGRYVAH